MSSTMHRQAHNGQFVICRRDGEQWPCPTVSAAAAMLDGLSDRCQFICPKCARFVWIQLQCGEMWCPYGDCGYYGSQFELLGLIFDPSLADVQADMIELSGGYR